ncbi:MAG: hypothetical protein ACOX38_08645 [Bacillota bacterium]
MRNNLEAEGTPIMIPGKRNTMRPTARMILDMLDTVQVAHVEHERIVQPRLDGFEAWVRHTATPSARGLCGRYLHRPFANTVVESVPKCADGNIYMRNVSSRVRRINGETAVTYVAIAGGRPGVS